MTPTGQSHGYSIASPKGWTQPVFADKARRPLIVDVGLHKGLDTDFYLKKGFRVVAIEAHPHLYRECAIRFAEAIERCDLRLYNVAIAAQPGEVEFFINEKKDDWGTIKPGMVTRNLTRGAPSSAIKVRAVRLDTILAEVGMPYYLKVDIEGADTHCLEALHRLNDRPPKFVSIELDMDDLDVAAAELCHLFALGYREFKLINQGSLQNLRCPNPPREGTFVDQPFMPHASGPFGEETPGEWISFDNVLKKIRRIVGETKLIGRDSPYFGSWWVSLYYRYRDLTGDPVAWYDLHAKLG